MRSYPHLIDAHTHIHFPVYDKDREAVIDRARAAGVKMVCVGTQAASSEAAVELVRKYPGEIWATAGFHPTHVAQTQHARTERGLTRTGGWYHDKKEQLEPIQPKFNIDELREIAKNPEVVAIGECGLDYYRLTDLDKEKNDQQEAFEVQIEIAKDLNKALMIHCRPSKGTDDAYSDLLGQITNHKSQIPKIVHFYVGSLAITKKLVEAGFYFTFGGVITFARDYDEMIKYIPLDHILLETDAPYVAPAPYRGKRNEPAYIVETGKKMAELKSASLEEVVEVTTNNALKVFKIGL